MDEIKIEISNELLEKNERMRRAKRIKVEIKEEEEEEEEPDQPPLPADFPKIDNSLENEENDPVAEDDSITGEPSTSEAVDIDEKRLKVFAKMCEDLPRMLRRIHRHLGYLNHDSEMKRDQLNSKIADEYLKGFNKVEKEKYRCWFEDEEWQEVIETHAKTWFKCSTKMDKRTGLEVKYIQKIKNSKIYSRTMNCVVCDELMYVNMMKQVPISTSIRNEYIKRLGPETAKKLKNSSRICAEHFPGGKLPRYESGLPNQIWPPSPKQLAKTKALKKKRNAILETIREDLPKTLRKIRKTMNSSEIPQEQLNCMIKAKYMAGFNEKEKKKHEFWFDDKECQAVIQAEIKKKFKRRVAVDTLTGKRQKRFRKIVKNSDYRPVSLRRIESDEQNNHENGKRISTDVEQSNEKIKEPKIVKQFRIGIQKTCIVCGEMKRTKMKLIPKTTEVRTAWIEVLGPEIAAKLETSSHMCLRHLPEGEYVWGKSFVPSRIIVEPDVEKLDNLNKTRHDVHAKIHDDLPDILQQICDNMKGDEIIRKKLDVLIEDKCLEGMSVRQKSLCRSWFKTEKWQTLVQKQINVYFENFKRKNAMTRNAVDYVRKVTLHPSSDQPEIIEPTVECDPPREVAQRKRPRLQTAALKCLGCQGEHNFNQCDILTLEQKYALVEQLNLCVVCGRNETDDHTAATCKFKSKVKLCDNNSCRMMGSSHSTSLCFISIIMRNLLQST